MHRHIGPLGAPKHTKWKYGVLKTMQEMLAKGALNASQIESMTMRGVNVASARLLAQLDALDLDSANGMAELVTLAKKHPNALNVLVKLRNS